MQITLTITEGFSCADELATFAAKLQEMFSGVMRPAAKPIIGAVSNSKEFKTYATPKPAAEPLKRNTVEVPDFICEPVWADEAPASLKRAADVTVEPRDVDPVDVAPVEAVERATEEATQEPTAGTACAEPKKRVRRTKDQIAADEAAKRAAEAAMIEEAKAPAPAPVASKPAAEVTEDDVRTAFGDLVDLEDGELAFAKILQRYGVKTISKIEPAKYAAVHADIIIEIGRLTRAADAPKSAKFAL